MDADSETGEIAYGYIDYFWNRIYDFIGLCRHFSKNRIDAAAGILLYI